MQAQDGEDGMWVSQVQSLPEPDRESGAYNFSFHALQQAITTAVASTVQDIFTSPGNQDQVFTSRFQVFAGNGSFTVSRENKEVQDRIGVSSAYQYTEMDIPLMTAPAGK